MTLYDADVIVVGAGPVGMTVAGLLGQHGVDVLLVEKNSTTCTHPRAQTIDDESMRTLQALKVAEKFAETTLRAEGSQYIDADGHCFAQIGPGPENFGFPKRSYMLQQNLEALLFERLEQLDSVSLRFGVEVGSVRQDEDSVSIQTVGGQSFRARYLLACDGGQSPVRMELGIAMHGQTYEKDWIVLDVTDDPDDRPESKFYCDPSRPAVSIASPGGGRRYEFMLTDGEEPDQVLRYANLEHLLAPFRELQPESIARRAVYTFHARMAERFRERRILLLGDAAHLSPPFAGQGMNAGIRDAHNVAWKLALLLRYGLDDAVLDSYEKERRVPTWAMIQLAVAMGEFVMPVGQQQISLTQSVMLALERFPEARDWLFHMKFKPKPRYSEGVFLDLQNPEFEASLVGEMIPQPAVTRYAGSSADSFGLDEVLGPGFALIVQNEASENAIASSDHILWQRLDPARVRFYREHDSSAGIVSFAESSGMLHTIDRVRCCHNSFDRPLRTHRDQVLLVRPDRYVAGSCYPGELSQFADRFWTLLQGV